MTKCPICKTDFVNKGYYSECGNFKCPTLLLGEKALHIDYEKVKQLLKHPALKTNKFAKSFLAFLEQRGFLTAAQLVYVVGDRTPKGTPTLQAVIQERTKQKISAGTLYADIPTENVPETTEPETPQALPKSTPSAPVLAREKRKTNSEIIVVEGTDSLLETKEFPYMEFTMSHFNPLQSKTANFVTRDINVVISAATSSGKTIVAEQFIAPIIKEGKKAIYISPLKALTHEKYDDWTDASHFFSRYKSEMLTGDYSLTPDRVQAIASSNIVLMTSEMLDSRTRKITSEKNDWLYDVGVVIIDEAHLLGMDGRGDNLECAIMRFTEQNPSAKIIFLSATMPNVQELADWLSYLNGKESILIQSSWRPVELELHFPTYPDRGYYKQKEAAKAEKAFEIIRKNPDDKFIVFTHTKSLGRQITALLESRLNTEVEFHCSELTKEKRIKLEKSFKQKDGGLRLLVATSTLAWGINAPARRVIVAGVHRGMTEVTAMEIIQMVGRSGRYGIDEKGDAYVLLPESNADAWQEFITNSEDVISRMTAPRVLSFHVISEIVRGVIKDREDLKLWYQRTLANFQDVRLNMDEFIEDIETALIHYKALKIVNDKYEATGLGKVSAWMYYHPVDVYNWFHGFGDLVTSNNIDDILLDPVKLSAALSVDKDTYPPADVQMSIDEYKRKCTIKGITPCSYVSGTAFYNILTSTHMFEYFNSLEREIKGDLSRITQTIALIDKLYGYWKLPDTTYKKMHLMLQYEVPHELTELCKVKWVGGKKARALYALGIRKIADVLNPNYKHLLQQVLKDRTDEAIASVTAK